MLNFVLASYGRDILMFQPMHFLMWATCLIFDNPDINDDSPELYSQACFVCEINKK